MMIFALWLAGIAFKTAAAGRMAMNGLGKRFPYVWGYIVFCSLYMSAALLSRAHPRQYLAVYLAGTSLGLLAQCAAVISVFWALSANYQNFRAIGGILLISLALVGFTAAFASNYVRVPAIQHLLTSWLWAGALFIQRYMSVVMAVVLIGARLGLPSTERIPIPACARRAADILALDAVIGMVFAWWSRSYGFSHPTVVALLPTMAGVIMGALWLFAMHPMEEKAARPLSLEEYNAASKMTWIQLHLLRAQLDDAVRQFERSVK